MNSATPNDPKPHIDISVDTKTVTFAFRLDNGWAYLAGYRSFDGKVHKVEDAVVFVGDFTEDELADFVMERADAKAPRVAPSTPLSSRLLRSGFRERLDAVAMEEIFRPVPVKSRKSHVSTVRTVGELLMFDAPVERPKRVQRASALSEEFLATVARRMVELQTSHPGRALSVLADEMAAGKYETAKGWLDKAVQRGLLSKPGKGKRNQRRLTPRAIEILSARGGK